MTPSIGMTLGMEKTEKERTAGLRMTSDLVFGYLWSSERYNVFWYAQLNRIDMAI